MSYLFSDYQQTRTNLKLLKYVPTAPQIASNTTWQYVEGSRIAYTPQSTESTVIYEYYVAFSYVDSENQADFKLEKSATGSSYTDYDTATSNQPYHWSTGTHGLNQTGALNDLVVLKYKLASWGTTQQYIQLSFKSRTGRASRSRLHVTEYPLNTGSLSYYNAFVMCYEV